MIIEYRVVTSFNMLHSSVVSSNSFCVNLWSGISINYSKSKEEVIIKFLPMLIWVCALTLCSENYGMLSRINLFGSLN